MSLRTISIIIIGIVALVAIAAAVVPRTNPEPATSDKLVVLSTFTVIADMVREVGGDRVDAVSLTKPGVEIHGYEPTPGDLVRASKASIIFDNGLNLEVWAEKLYSTLPQVPHVTLSEGIAVRSIKEGAYEGKPNPHAWMSPKQALIYVENIRKALVKLSPEDEGYFNQRAADYSSKIRTLDTKLESSLATIPESHRYLVSCEGAFSYLTNDYRLNELYLWAINDDSQGSPQQIARVVDEVKAKKIPTVFCESTVEPRIQQEVANTSGAKLGGVLYVDSLSAEDGPAPSYLKLLEYTVATIIDGLAK
jgi:manganese transport system substrate-binding protein